MPELTDLDRRECLSNLNRIISYANMLKTDLISGATLPHIDIVSHRLVETPGVTMDEMVQDLERRLLPLVPMESRGHNWREIDI